MRSQAFVFRIAAIRSLAPALLFGLSTPMSHAQSAQTPTGAPPLARSEPVVDTYHGTTITDNYRWLEDTNSPQSQGWMKAQADFARKTLDAIPGRASLFTRMMEVEDSVSTRVSRVTQLTNGNVLYLRRLAGDQHTALVLRADVNAPENEIVDPRTHGPTHAIDYFFASPNGQLVAYGVSPAGSERADFYIKNIVTGKLIAGPIANAMWNGFRNTKWSPDSKRVYFLTLRDLANVTDKSETFKWMRTWAIDVAADGASASAPVLIHDGRSAMRVDTSTEQEGGLPTRVAGSPFEIFTIADGVRKYWRFLAKAASDRDGAWKSVVQYSDEIQDAAVSGSTLFALSDKGVARSRILAADLANPNWTNARVVIPEQVGVILDFAVAADGVYATVLEGAQTHVLRAPHSGGRIEKAALPFAGSVRISSYNANIPGVIIEYGGWTQAHKFFTVQPNAANTLAITRLPFLADSKFDTFPNMQSRVEMAVSHDGTQVPISIVGNAQALSAKAPVPAFIVAYGAYGFTQEPRLRAEWVPVMERGYVYANCHVRGGGEYGRAWYEAGKIHTKPNTWKDLIACAEHLVKQGYTTPAKLGILGWSAGGITVGRAMTERPDLFAAAAPGVGVLDAVRAESEANGPGNAVEFGTIKKPDEFQALLAMSAYHQVKPNVKYPAVILPHGVTDQRVAVWHSAKFAALLQATPPQAKPVLLNIDYAAGHGRGSTAAQRNGTFADTIAFMLWQMGEPGFALK